MSTRSVLELRGLSAEVAGRELLTGVDLTIRAGELHLLMGPNGSGKSSLAQLLAGDEAYRVTGGSIRFLGEDLLPLSPEDRARRGLFLAFQYPVELPGVNNTYFLKAAVNARRKEQGLPPLDAADFLERMQRARAELGMDTTLLDRPVNVGFSGGEKKKNEVLQLSMLDPELAILDETDSGLDLDALQIVTRAIRRIVDAGRSVLLVTHYPRVLDLVTPDFVHVLAGGVLRRSGGPELAEELGRRGYGWLAAHDPPPPRAEG